MKKILTILAITVPVLCGNTQAGPKFKSYVEMQAERRAKADAVSARYDAERKIAAENALAEKARVAQLKVEREEHIKKLQIAAAGATRVNVSVAQSNWR
jgi:hypothetical protein